MRAIMKVAAASSTVICLFGCASTKDYELFANSGKTYTDAVDKALLAEEKTKVDATSERILDSYDLKKRSFAETKTEIDSLTKQRDLLTKKQAQEAAKITAQISDRSDDLKKILTAEDYKTISKQDESFIETSRALREQTALFGRYFDAMYRLATTNAAETAGNEAKTLGNNLNTLQQKIAGENAGGRKLIPDTDLLGALAENSIKIGIRGALADEISQRRETLQKVLATQQVLMQLLEISLTSDIKQIKEAKEQRKVIEPLLKPEPIENKDEFVAARESILAVDPEQRLAEFKAAKSAEITLRKTFINLVGGELTPAQATLTIKQVSATLIEPSPKGN